MSPHWSLLTLFLSSSVFSSFSFVFNSVLTVFSSSDADSACFFNSWFARKLTFISSFKSLMRFSLLAFSATDASNFSFSSFSDFVSCVLSDFNCSISFPTYRNNKTEKHHAWCVFQTTNSEHWDMNRTTVWSRPKYFCDKILRALCTCQSWLARPVQSKGEFQF